MARRQRESKTPLKEGSSVALVMVSKQLMSCSSDMWLPITGGISNLGEMGYERIREIPSTQGCSSVALSGE